MTDSGPSPTPFEAAVYRALSRLEPGEVVTYGDIAGEAGFPGAARAVGMLLARADTDVAWWRVVTSSGRLVPGYEAEHARRLRAEGRVVRGEGPRARVVRSSA
ncbi:MAG TPA: MGMT family protein [Acidimicrobiales bacterium]|nr:MGMT family protein [Acidimicrobiales bacterium]